jgi:hypothetical protein
VHGLVSGVAGERYGAAEGGHHVESVCLDTGCAAFALFLLPSACTGLQHAELLLMCWRAGGLSCSTLCVPLQLPHPWPAAADPMECNLGCSEQGMRALQRGSVAVRGWHSDGPALRMSNSYIFVGAEGAHKSLE